MSHQLLVLTASFLHFFSLLKAETAQQIIMHRRAAVSISPVRLYADSTYTKSTETTFTEGVLFEVISESAMEHFDNTQNQTFRWFKVRTLSGITGWIFGDNLAVVTPENWVENNLKPYYKKPAVFDNGFEKATTWLAHTEGHDIPTQNRDHDVYYRESYLVVTNVQGRSVLLNYANDSETSQKVVQTIHFQDLTDNNTPEIILETIARPQGNVSDERVLEIYTFKLGNLHKIFEERLSLFWDKNMPSPALAKFVDTEGGHLRVSYIDFLPCDKSILPFDKDIRSRTQERCLEQVTYSFAWDKLTRTFKTLYSESRRPVQAVVNQPIMLKTTPSVSSPVLVQIQPNERLQVLKHYENLVVENNKKLMDNWLLVRHPSGMNGYIRAVDVIFKNTEHAAILKAYYAQPPLVKQDWKRNERFLMLGN
jgi:hypothetical protein